MIMNIFLMIQCEREEAIEQANDRSWRANKADGARNSERYKQMLSAICVNIISLRGDFDAAHLTSLVSYA